jgi:tetratricopeptide (TPR) repeat protein
LEEQDEIEPQDSNGWYSKGNKLLGVDTYYEAIKCYDKAIEIAPHVTITQVRKNAALRKLGRYGEALTNLDIELKGNAEKASELLSAGVKHVI